MFPFFSLPKILKTSVLLYFLSISSEIKRNLLCFLIDYFMYFAILEQFRHILWTRKKSIEQIINHPKLLPSPPPQFINLAVHHKFWNPLDLIVEGFSLWDIVKHHIFLVRIFSMQSVMKRHEKSFGQIYIYFRCCKTFPLIALCIQIKLPSLGKEEIFFPVLSESVNFFIQGLLWVTFRLQFILINPWQVVVTAGTVLTQGSVSVHPLTVCFGHICESTSTKQCTWDSKYASQSPF